MNDDIPGAVGEVAAEAAARPAHPPILKRHILAATIGNGLEFYDFSTYSYFALEIGRTFFPLQTPMMSLLASLGTFGIGFIFRPVGGYVLGRYSDRVGRRPAMMLSFMLMGFSILGLALIPSYAAIGLAAPALVILARIVQGFALGGEVGPTNAFLLEAAPVAKRGLFSTFQGVSQNISGIIGGGVGLLLSTMLSVEHLDTYGWRVAFLLGGLTLPFGLILRRSLPETIHRKEEFVTHASGTKSASIFETHGRTILLTFLIFSSGTIGTYVFQFMTTYARAILKMGASASFGVTVVINAVGLIGGLASGAYSDRFGRRPLMILPRFVFIVATLPVFLWIVHVREPLILLTGVGFLAFFSSASQGATYAALAESLPKEIRGTGFALIYALAISIFGGSAQLVVAWLIDLTKNNLAPAWYLIAASTIGMFAMIALAESAPSRVHGLGATES